MPLRKTPLVTGQIYHIFNRGVNKQPIFFTPRSYRRAVNTVRYYLIHKPPVPYSKTLTLPAQVRSEIGKTMINLRKGVEIISYSLMPNHFHFLLKQLIDEGIKDFIRNFQISNSKYINKRFDRIGPLLQGQFKAVLIEDDEQLIHVSRYIHLNPYTSFVVKNIEDLKTYPWSSLPEYLGVAKEVFCSKSLILSMFKNKTGKYWEFLANQADYQRRLDAIKHLTLE